jgi:hypothetical protein
VRGNERVEQAFRPAVKRYNSRLQPLRYLLELGMKLANRLQIENTNVIFLERFLATARKYLGG